MFDDTIVAVATANGIGSISIVRLSGSKALEIGLSISKKTQLQARFATLSSLYTVDNEIIDEALLIYFKSPFSFTGEDIVEFQCHGGIAVSYMVVNETIKLGARTANPGEFSKRAFLNNKIDLSKAEAIAKLIEARSEDSVKLLAKQLKGELGTFVDEIREDLLFMLAYTEVTIDYAEEDLPSDIYQQIHDKLTKISIKLQNTLDSSKRREGMISGFKVTIIGKPNVGKSSLLNKLLNYDRAIISDIEGTTRDTIEENIKIGTHLLKIVDTAGIREASDAIEKIGIEKSLEAVKESDIIIVLFDNSKNYSIEDENILKLINKFSSKKIIKVVNKSDLESKFDTKLIESHISLNTREDINPLIRAIERLLDQNTDGEDITLVSKRQVDSVTNTLNNIKLSYEPLESGELEFFAYYIKESLNNISQITKAYENDQMLDVMFGAFCLGK